MCLLLCVIFEREKYIFLDTAGKVPINCETTHLDKNIYFSRSLEN